MQNADKQQTTFWNFIQEYKIEIPIIQRDYAQGRRGKEKLREIFLIDLKNALDGYLSNEEKSLKLDFVYGSVYGSVEDKKINPLDGQQRLTTLWLLHWFIAYKKQNISEEEKKLFGRFTYETRTSSRDFCNKLSSFNIQGSTEQDENIASLIQTQIWFSSVWKQDPTILAMLNMLDSIEMCFLEKKESDFAKYWESLTSGSPIIFYDLELKELGLSDDLYIKMNARGKALTSFENFKADLVRYIKDKGLDKSPEICDTMTHKLDTSWTDIFWKFRSPKHKIDDSYLAFINRFLLNSLITAKEDESGGYLHDQKKIQGDDFYNHLVKGTTQDYSNFEVYKQSWMPNALLCLDKTMESFSNFSKLVKDKTDINKLFCPSWDLDSDFRFIPEYDSKDKVGFVEKITFSQRVVFFAISRYFEIGEYDEVSLKRWMRIVWNIAESGSADSADGMFGAMRLIDELAGHSHNIYDIFANVEFEIKSASTKDQVAEEREKVRQIVADPACEAKIIAAESYAFWKGCISFLFTDRDGVYNWDLFDSRFANVQKYFDKSGVSEAYRVNARLVCSFISLFTKWEQCWGSNKVSIGNGVEVWRSIIKNTNLLQPLSDLLDLDEIPTSVGDLSSRIEVFEADHEETEKLAHEDMCNNGLISEAIKHMGEGILLNWRYDSFALYCPRANADWKKYIVGTIRNKILFDLTSNDIIETRQRIRQDIDQQVLDLPYFWGWNIFFKRKSNENMEFVWDKDGCIYLNTPKQRYMAIEVKQVAKEYTVTLFNPNPEVTVNNLSEYAKELNLTLDQGSYKSSNLSEEQVKELIRKFVSEINV